MKAPETLRIEKRDRRFDFDSDELRSWHPEGPHVTHWLNAMSIFFPEGEKFFIEAVRHYRDRIDDPQLAADVHAFVGQEAMHSREHRRYNEALAEAGYPVERLEGWLKGFLGRVRKRSSPMERLATTIALEHFTAILAGQVLEDETVLADGPIPELWRWHAIEETEHKAVAFDVYAHVVGRGASAYVLRSVVMLTTTVIFWALVFRYHWVLVKTDGRTRDVRGWFRLARFLLWAPGVFPKLVGPWAQYFRFRFHPWQDDNHHFVEEWKANAA